MNLVELAIRIRKLRRRQDITLASLARQSGLTQSTMSKIENFRITPSLPALGNIAQALGTTLSELLKDLDQSPQTTVLRKNERREVTRDNSPWRYYLLSDENTSRQVDPFMVEIPPGLQRAEPHAHEGYEFMLLLEGTLEYQYGARVINLEEGDSVYADGTVSHNLINQSESTARLLVVYCHAGDVEGEGLA